MPTSPDIKLTNGTRRKQGRRQSNAMNDDEMSLPMPVSALSNPNRENCKQAKNARIDREGLKVRWARFKQRLGTGSAVSESLLEGGGESDTSYSFRKATGAEKDDGGEEGAGEVDEVVVDNELGDKASVTQPSEHDTNENPRYGSSHGTAESTSATQHTYGIWESYMVLTILRWRLWPAISSFFTLRFFEENTEVQ